MNQNRLRFHRINAGLSQHELAEASGVHRCHIQLAEAAIRLPSIQHQKMLAECLDIPVEELFSLNERKYEKA